jgi:hypothetical protein
MGEPGAATLRVLYLTANPDGGMRVDDEIRRVKTGVRAATHRDLVELRHLPAVTPGDLLDELARFAPHVVHFSGHTNESVLVFDTGTEMFTGGERIPIAAFAMALDAVDEPPRMVVLNGCSSHGQFAALLEVVPLAVGMSDDVEDVDAMAFAARFYSALAEGQSVNGAFKLARAQLALGGLPAANLPVLAHAPDTDPAETILVEPNTPGSSGSAGVRNTINGGIISGQVIQGRDFHGPIHL